MFSMALTQASPVPATVVLKRMKIVSDYNITLPIYARLE